MLVAEDHEIEVKQNPASLNVALLNKIKSNQSFKEHILPLVLTADHELDLIFV